MRDDRWQHLVRCAFAVSDSGTREDRAEVLERLASVLEVFPSSIDPNDDFEGYAVRRLILSMLEVLDAAPDEETPGPRLALRGAMLRPKEHP